MEVRHYLFQELLKLLVFSYHSRVEEIKKPKNCEKAIKTKTNVKQQQKRVKRTTKAK